MIISFSLATVLAGSLIFIFLLWLLITKLPAFLLFKKQYNFSKTLPGPSIRDLIRNAKNGRILLWMKELRAQHGKVFRIWFGTDLTVFFSDPDDVQAILSNNQLLNKSNNYNVLEAWLGKGLLTNSGNEWRIRRKLLTPAFHFKILSAFKKPMEDNCDILISKLQEKLTADSFDIYPYLTLYAMDVICETAMGIKKHAQINSQSEYVTAVQTLCHVSHKQSFSFWHRFGVVFNRSELGKLQKQALKVVHSETWRVIDMRRKLLETDQVEMNGNNNVEDFGIKRRLAFLDMLLLAQLNGTPINDSEIREEVDTFMFEGHDTTSSALGFIIYLLSKHSNVQRKCYEEVKLVAGNEQNSMKYLEAVIKESLRLYPPVPFYSRMLLEDLFIDNILIPKGTAVSVLAYLVHRNPRIYPEPEEFRPERFLTDEQIHPFSFVPFSAGTRNCIGQKFAMLELKCTISKLLQNFEILPVENFVPEPLAELVMKSGNGIQIKLRKRL